MYTQPKITITAIIVLLSSLMACKKDKPTTPTPPIPGSTSSSYLPIASSTPVSIPFSPGCPPDIASRAFYEDDATKLALSYLYDHHLGDTMYITVDAGLRDAFISALAAVKSSASLQRDSVIDRYQIHAVRTDEMREIYVKGDSTVTWFQNLYTGNLVTGNVTFDSLHLYCQFSYLHSTNSFGAGVVLRTGMPVNPAPLCKTLDQIYEVHNAEPNIFVTDGNRITLNAWNSSYIELIYSHGWGDCPSGCTGRRYWKFRVHPDCTVDFVESYGSPAKD